MRSFLSALLVTIFILSYGQLAHAQGANDAEAEELRVMFSENMMAVKNIYKDLPGINLDYEGDVSIKPVADYYNITFPKIFFGIENPNNPADSFNLHVDSIVINASKKAGDVWAMSMAIPTPIQATDGNDEAIFNINVGKQTSQFLLMPSLFTAPKYNLVYEDISIDVMGKDKLEIKLDKFIYAVKLEENAKGLWNGPGRIALENVVVSNDDFAFNLDSTGMDVSYEDFDLKGVASMYKKMMDSSLFAENMNAQETLDMMNDSLKGLFQSMGGMTTSMFVNGLKSSYLDKRTGKMGDFALNHADIGFGVHGLRSNAGSVDLTTSMNGLVSSDIPASVKGLVPEDSDFKMRVVNLPMQSLIEMALSGINQTVNSGQVNSAQLNAQMIKLLTDSGTKIILDKNNMNMPELGIKMFGEASANMNAILGGVVDFTMKLRNLDAVIAKYSQAEGVPMAVKQMVGGLAMFQQMGQIETSENGQPVRSYHFELTPEGQTLLNGSDMSPMLGMMRQ